MKPVDTHVSDVSARMGLARALAVAAVVVGVLFGLGFFVHRRADLAPGQSSDGSTTTAEPSTVRDPGPRTPELEATALYAALSDAGIDMSRLPDTVMDAISDVASGATHLCGFEDLRSPANETGIAINSTARRCFLDSYLIGSPAVVVLQGPTYLNPPGTRIWSARADRSVSIDETSAGTASGQDEVWTLEHCGRISTDTVSSADPPEFFQCAGAPLTLVAEESEAPAWFVDRQSFPLCGYSIPPSDDDAGAGCFADSVVDGEPAEYVIVAADGHSVVWMRSLDVGLYERIDWRVSSDGVTSWARRRCTLTDTPDATIPLFPGDRPHSCDSI